MKKLIILAVILGLSGCGYHLRGTTDTLHKTHTTVALSVNANQKISDSLKKELALNGIDSTADSQNRISINNTNIARYELIGVLTEIRLVLTATVSYQINGKTEHHTLTATRSYQYNEAGVSSQDKEEAKVKEWLYGDLARQISEQFYTLNQATPAP